MNRAHTLVINRWESHCGGCGRPASLHEHTHDTVPGREPAVGCGTRWVLVDSDYLGLDPTLSRPDLAPTGFAVGQWDPQ